MKLHANARTCPNSRRLLVERIEAGWSLAEAAAAAGVSDPPPAKWRARWRAAGARSVLGSQAGSSPHPRVASRGDRCAATVADDCGGDR